MEKCTENVLPECCNEIKRKTSVIMETDSEVPLNCSLCTQGNSDQLEQLKNDILNNLNNFKTVIDESVKKFDLTLLHDIKQKLDSNEKYTKVSLEALEEHNKFLSYRIDFLESELEKVGEMKNGFIEEIVPVRRDSDKKIRERVLRSEFFRFGLVAIVLLGLTTVGLAIYNNKNSGTEIIELPKNFTKRLIKRGDWLALPEKIPIGNLTYHPAKFIVVSHTAGSFCYEESACSSILRSIQAWHFEQDYDDIGYSFLIGGDGLIYEGRGWNKYGAHTWGFNCDSTGVSFIGDYTLVVPGDVMIEAFNLLVEEGVRIGEIEEDYKLFAQTQIRATDSPGKEIIDRMKHWNNWTSYDIKYRICDKPT